MFETSLSLCNAVWVYCGDQEKCGSQYQQCWLKHLVRSSCGVRQNPMPSASV